MLKFKRFAALILDEVLSFVFGFSMINGPIKCNHYSKNQALAQPTPATQVTYLWFLLRIDSLAWLWICACFWGFVRVRLSC